MNIGKRINVVTQPLYNNGYCTYSKLIFQKLPKKSANNFFFERDCFPLCGCGNGQNKTICNSTSKVVITSDVN